jgi:hypothetical protein
MSSFSLLVLLVRVCWLPVDYILFLRADVDVKPNPNEASEIKWVTADQLRAFIASGRCELTPSGVGCLVGMSFFLSLFLCLCA